MRFFISSKSLEERNLLLKLQLRLNRSPRATAIPCGREQRASRGCPTVCPKFNFCLIKRLSKGSFETIFIFSITANWSSFSIELSERVKGAPLGSFSSSSETLFLSERVKGGLVFDIVSDGFSIELFERVKGALLCCPRISFSD